MAKSRTFGAVPRDSVLVRVQATRNGKILSTQSYRVVGATLEAVCGAIEPALANEFGRGSGETDDDEGEDEPPSTPAPLQEMPQAASSPRAFSIEDVVERSRRLTSEIDFQPFLEEVRQSVPAPQRKSVGALTGRAVMDFQNWLYEENVKWRLTDLQLLAVMRTEFPWNSGQVFTADIATGLGHIASIRADYNRTGHGGETPEARGLRPSVSYGRIKLGDLG